VRLAQHGPGPLKKGTVKSVTYTFGPMFSEHTRTVTSSANDFATADSLYDPLLVVAEVAFSDGTPRLLLDRYVNFDESSESTIDDEVAEAISWDQDHFGLVVHAMHTGNPTLLHLDDVPSPFIDFVFEVVNGSVLNVLIDREMEGEIVCSGTGMQRRPTLRLTDEWATAGMKHGWRTHLELRQWLTPEEVTWIKAKRDLGEQIWCSFQEIKLTVRAGDRKQRLDLNRGQPVYPALH
jgi:hypothetical protein